MFTGIIRHVGTILAATPTAAGKSITIDLGPIAAGLGLGDSVAVAGTCLTAAAINGREVRFDVVAETLDRTTLGQARRGDRVNLEPALRLSDALDGHMVQGHVDGVAEVARIDTGPAGHVLELAADEELTDQMVPKGAVALAGVSLTLAAVAKGRFSVALVPTTVAETTLGEVKISDALNVESDIIGKYVCRYLQQTAGGGLTIEKLREEGFA